MNPLDELVLAIFNAHQGEWLSPKTVAQIADAIKGYQHPLPAVRKSISYWLKQKKIIHQKKRYTNANTWVYPCGVSSVRMRT